MNNLIVIKAVLLMTLVLLISACSSSEELSPEEAAFMSHVVSAENLIQSAGSSKPSLEQCEALRSSIKNAEAAFKVILPTLKPFDVRKKDKRIGDIKTYVEGNC